MKKRWALVSTVAVAAAMACGSSGETNEPTSLADAGPNGVGDADARGDGNSNTGEGGADDDDDVINPNPTVSNWLGTNLSGDLPRVDIGYQMLPFDTAAAQKDARGYPVANAKGTSHTDLGFVLPTGDYTVRYKGDGKVTVGGIAKLQGAFATVDGKQQGIVHIEATPQQFGRFLDVTIENGAGQTVTDLVILAPGFKEDGTVFRPEFISLIAPFRALRFMDWEATNGSKLADWKDRPTSTSFGQGNGEPYEQIIELVNVTGKDMWLTIPEHATDDFIHQFGKLLASKLDFARIKKARNAAGFKTPFRLFVEPSNETWNTGFSAFKTYNDEAKKDAGKYTGTYDGTYGPKFMSDNADLMRVGQYEADKLVTIGKILKEELGANSAIVSPILSGWALGAAYSDVGLRFIKAKYGKPSDFVYGVALAPYFGAKDDDADALPKLFAAMDADVASKEATYNDFKKLGVEYGIQITAYEGGQGLTGEVHQNIKHLAQHDQRMFDSYAKYHALWKKVFGESLFMHFSLAGTPGIPEFIFQFGYWGSIGGVLEDTTKCRANLPTLLGTEAIATVVDHCPKYAALAAQVP